MNYKLVHLFCPLLCLNCIIKRIVSALKCPAIKFIVVLGKQPNSKSGLKKVDYDTNEISRILCVTATLTICVSASINVF